MSTREDQIRLFRQKHGLAGTQDPPLSAEEKEERLRAFRQKHALAVEPVNLGVHGVHQEPEADPLEEFTSARPGPAAPPLGSDTIEPAAAGPPAPRIDEIRAAPEEDLPLGAAIGNALKRGAGQMVEALGGASEALPSLMDLYAQSPALAEQAPSREETAYFRAIEAGQELQAENPASASVEAGGAFDPRNPRWWLERGLEQAPQMLSSIGLGVATGGVGGFVLPTLLQEGGQGYLQTREHLLQQGEDVAGAEAKARGAALLTGIGAAALETIPGSAILLKRIPGAGDVLTRGILQRLAAGAAAEGGAEVGQEAWADVVEYAATQDPETFADWQSRYAGAGALGAAIGGGASVATGAEPLLQPAPAEPDPTAQIEQLADAFDAMAPPVEPAASAPPAPQPPATPAPDQGREEVIPSTQEPAAEGGEPQGAAPPAARRTLYHGTTEDFEAFDLGRAGRRDSGNLGRGVYLSPDVDRAARYAQDNTKKFGGSPRLLTVEADLQNTADFLALRPEIEAATGVILPLDPSNREGAERVRQYMLSRGHDSAQLGSDGEIVVYDPSRLRVAGADRAPSEREMSIEMVRERVRDGRLSREKAIEVFPELADELANRAPAPEPKRNLFGEEEAPTVEQAELLTARDLAPAEKAAAERVAARPMNAEEVTAQTRRAREEGTAPAPRDAEIEDLFRAPPGTPSFLEGLEDPAPTRRGRPARTAEDAEYQYRPPRQRRSMFTRELPKAKAMTDAALLKAYGQKLQAAVRMDADATGNGGSFVRANSAAGEARLAAYEQVIEARGLERPSAIDAWRNVPESERAERFALFRAMEEAEGMMDPELLDALDVVQGEAQRKPGSRDAQERAYAFAAVAKDRGLVGGSMFEETIGALYADDRGGGPALLAEEDAGDGGIDELDAKVSPPTRGRIAPAPIKGGTPKALDAIILDLSRGVGRQVRKAKTRAGGVTGTYFPGSARTIIRYAGDVDTTAHEVAHALDDRYSIVGAWAGDRKRSPYDAELIPNFSGYGSVRKSGPRSKLAYQRAEGVAEWVRAWIVNPAEAETAAPQFAAHFKRTVPAAELARLEAFSRDVREFAGMDPLERTKANIETVEDAEGGSLEEIRAALSREGYEIRDRWLEGLNVRILDSLAPLMRGIRDAQRLAGVDQLNPSRDPHILARLFGGFNDKLLDVLENGPINAENQRVPGAGGVSWLLEWADTSTEASLQQDMDDVAAFMVSQRVVERAARIDAETEAQIDELRQREQDGRLTHERYLKLANRLRGQAAARKSRLSGAGGGIYDDAAQAAAALKEVEGWAPERRARVEDGAKRYRRWSDAVLRYMVDKGRLSEEQYQEITSANRHYVAMHRIATEIDPEAFRPGGRGGGRLGSSADPVKQFKGSTRKIGNPYVNLLQQTAVMMREADRNEVLLRFTEILSPPPPGRGMYSGGVVDFDAIGSRAQQGDTNAIKVYRGGEAEHWQFEERIHESMKGFGNEYRLPPVLTIAGRTMRYFVTHSPDFLVRNVIRDSTHRSMISRTGSKPWDVLKRLTDEEVSRFQRAGGGNAGFYRQDRIAHAKELRKRMLELAGDKRTILATPRALVDGWEKLSSGSELIGRMAEYRSALTKAKEELGYSDYDAELYAAFQARDLIDYAVAGTWGRVANQLVPFTNPALQGLRRMVRAAGENPRRLAMLWATYALAPTLATYAWNMLASGDEGEEYLQQPDYIRDLFWNFKIGPDLWLRLPKSFEAGVLATGVERALDRIGINRGLKPNAEGFDGYWASLAKSFAPVDESALLGPARLAVEVMTNYDLFRERHIISPFDEGKAMALRSGTQYASRLGKAFSALIPGEQDPRMVDYLIRGQFGGIGRLVVRASDLGREDLGEEGRDLVMSASGLGIHSPGAGAKDVEWMLSRAKYLGISGRAEFDRLEELRSATFEGSARDRDAAARKLRIEARRLRKKYEDVTPEDVRRQRGR